MDAKYWKEKANAYAKEQNGGSAGSGIIQESYIAGITDYKKSLCEAIEKRLTELQFDSQGTSTKFYRHTSIYSTDDILELLDTVTPT